MGVDDISIYGEKVALTGPVKLEEGVNVTMELNTDHNSIVISSKPLSAQSAVYYSIKDGDYRDKSESLSNPEVNFTGFPGGRCT